MTKRRALHIITLVLFGFLLVALPASAQDGEIAETFDDPTLPNWEHSPETIVSGGVLQIPSGNFALRFGDWYQPTIEVRLRSTGEGEIMIQYHVADASRYNLVILTDVVILIKEQDESGEELGGAEFQIQSGEWVDLRIEVADGQHQISIDQETVLTASDPEPLPPGAILLHAVGEVQAEFDDLSIVPGNAEPPPQEGGGEPPPEEVATPAGGEVEQDDGGQGGLVEEFFASQANATDLTTFVINLTLAAVASFVLGRVYIHWGSSLSNRRRFAANFMLMTVTTTFIILVVRSSVALSLGLVGALSIVRFRTAVKEPEELAYLFFAIGLGIGLGDNQRLITLLALAAAVVIIGLSRMTRQAQADVNLHLSISSHAPSKVDLEQVVGVLEPHCAKLKLLRFDENDQTLEMSFLVEFKRMSDLSQAKAALRGLAGPVDITFLDNKGIW